LRPTDSNRSNRRSDIRVQILVENLCSRWSAVIKNRQWFCNISTVALEAIRAVLRDPFIGEHVKLVVQNREKIQFAATELGFNVREGFGNFVLIRHPDSQHLVRFLDSQGICVTDTAVHGLEDHVRISIGTVAENDALLEGLRRYASQFGIRSIPPRSKADRSTS
jgi:histidinol-phosphate/aromatic aminotransferase/cobyric acid decarboxylase-like protein